MGMTRGLTGLTSNFLGGGAGFARLDYLVSEGAAASFPDQFTDTRVFNPTTDISNVTFNGIDLTGGTTKVISIAGFANDSDNREINSATIAGVPATIYWGNDGSAWESCAIIVATGVTAQSGAVYLQFSNTWNRWQGDSQVSIAAYTSEKENFSFQNDHSQGSSGAMTIGSNPSLQSPAFCIGVCAINENGVQFDSGSGISTDYSVNNMGQDYTGIHGSTSIISPFNPSFVVDYSGSQWGSIASLTLY